MANKQGTNQIVDSYIGDKLIEARYIGQTKYFDPYTTLTGTLPLSFNARLAGSLKNYRLYGDSDGAGEETENLFDYTATDPNNGYLNGYLLNDEGDPYAVSGCYGSEYIELGGNTDYTLVIRTSSGPYDYYFCLYDSNHNKSRVLSCNTYATFTTLSTEKYIRCSSPKSLARKTMLVKGSTAPTTYIPFGYKIPILCQSGVTENLWDGKFPSEPSSTNQYIPIYVGDGTFTFSTNAPRHLNQYCAYMFLAGNVKTGGTSANNGVYAENPRTVQSVNGYVTIVYHYYSTADPRNYWGMLNKGTTPLPYEPHRYESNYDLFIGDSKLGATEYLDFSEQKIYKDVAGTLTPTDPPVAFPAITTYLGENTLSSTETVGNVMVKGRISEITS